MLLNETTKAMFFSPAYRRTLETEVSVTDDDDDDGPYSLSYPSNCLVCQNIIVWYARTLLFGMPEHYCLVYQNIYPGCKGRP